MSNHHPMTLRRARGRAAVTVAATLALLTATLIATVATPARAAVVVHDHTITGCVFFAELGGDPVTSIDVPASGGFYAWAFDGVPEDDASLPWEGQVIAWTRVTINGAVFREYAGSGLPSGSASLPGADDDPDVSGLTTVLELWKSSAFDMTAQKPFDTASGIDLDDPPLCTLTLNYAEATGDGDGEGDGDGAGDGDGDGDGDGGEVEGPAAHPKTLTACEFTPSSATVSPLAPASYSMSVMSTDPGYTDGDSIFVRERFTLDGEVQFGGWYTTLLASDDGQFVFDDQRDGQVWVWEIAAVDDTFDDAGGMAAPDYNTGANFGDVLCSFTFTYGDVASGDGPTSTPAGPTPAGSDVGLTCAPLSAPVGATVTCTVTGGDAGVSMLWRAMYNPVFVEAGVTLGADGTGTFSFVVPAAARGQEVMVELVEWTAPVSIGVAGGGSLVPTSVPAGEGPDAPIVPLAVTVASALVAGMVVRRWAVELRG